MGGRPAPELVDEAWVRDEFIPGVQQRGAEIIAARGLSSAASAGFAALSHMRDWVRGSPDGDWLSMAVPSDGSYGIGEGLIYSYPVTVRDGRYTIVPGLEIDDFAREKMDATRSELEEERDAVRDACSRTRNPTCRERVGTLRSLAGASRTGERRRAARTSRTPAPAPAAAAAPFRA